MEKKPEPEKKEEDKKEAEKGEPMETDKMNESQEKDSAEAMDTQEDKKEEGDAPQGIIWSFTNQIIIIWPSVTSNVGDDNESLPTLLNIGENKDF